MTSSYVEIYSRFLSKVTDPQLSSLPEEVVYEFMKEWLHNTISNPYIRRLFSTFSTKDEILEMSFELKDSSGDENTDKDFVQELFAKGMLIEWLEPQVNSKLLTLQMFGGKEEKFFAQANQLKENRELLSSTKTELRKMIRDHAYIHNSYISGN